MHELMPSEFWYLPPTQSVQPMAPALLHIPTPQISHSAA
jgi:hypothetical protein